MHYKVIDGNLVEMTEEEATEVERRNEEAEAEYWANISYEDAVNNEIRKKYSASAEFAILRQKDEKPDEYAEYFTYCEECKELVKSKKTTTEEGGAS